VGEDFVHRVTDDSFLAVGCPGCGLVYLSPQPAVEEHARVYPPSYFSPSHGSGRGAARRARAAARRAVRACSGLRPDARVLEVCYGATVHLDDLRATGPRTWVLEAVTPHETLARSARQAGFTVWQGYPHELDRGSAAYDAVLLLYGLEHCPSPVEELESIGRLLRPGGTLLILTENADSTVARLFRGRHWAGYDFPRHRALFGPGPLHRLADATGFEVTRIRTLPASEPWLGSAALLFQDWASLSWLASVARLATPLLSGLAWIADAGCSLRGRGARLEAVLRKPETNPR